MKCIYCQRDASYRDRSDRKCPNCRKPFAFEPKDYDPLTDGAFQAAIDRVSSNGTVRWGVEHLRYEIARKLLRDSKGKRRVGAVIGSLVSAIPLVNLHLDPTLFFGAWAGVAMMVSALFLRSAKTAPVPAGGFESMWRKWLAAHGEPKGLIVRRDPKGAAGRKNPVEPEPDLGDYSFDRAVICDRARTVDLLLANNFHFENNCAVLSVGGYPERAFTTVLAMLKRNPKLDVYALHDCSPDGCRLAHTLATDKRWFPGSKRILDVGLSPRHVKPLRGLWEEADSKPRQTDILSRSDREFLEEHRVDLAVIRPEQVIKRLYRAIVSGKVDEPKALVAGDTSSSSSGDSFAFDASVSDGGADSFG